MNYKNILLYLIIFSSIFSEINDYFPLYYSHSFSENLEYETILKIDPMPDQGGSFINDVYLITTSSGTDLVLKLENPIWKACKTFNEVSSIQFLQKNTKIPIPKIIEYCDDLSISPFKHEFIIMSREKGKAFNLVFDEIYNTKEVYHQILVELADVIAQLHSIRLNHMGNVEYVDKELKVTCPIEFPIHQDFKPCEKFSQYAHRWLSFYIDEMKRFEIQNHPNKTHFFKLIPLLENFASSKNFQFLDMNEDIFVYCHQDFVMKNILIHEGHVSAILDWEWSGPSLPEFETKTGFDFLPTVDDKKFFEDLMILRGFPGFFKQPPPQRQLFYKLIGDVYSIISCYEWIEGKLEHSAKFLDQKLEQRMVKTTKNFDIENFSKQKAKLIECYLNEMEYYQIAK